MKKYLLLLAAFVSLASLARAGNVTTYPNVSSVTSADLFFDWQSGTQQNATAAQLKTYLLGGGTLAIASSKTLTDSNTLTLTGTDGSTVNFGAGGTVLYSLGTGTTTEAWSAKLDALAALSSPSTSGYLLSSSSSGTLTWIAPYVFATASGTNTYVATPSPALTAYTIGQPVSVKFTNANTGGASLNLNGLGAVAIQQNGVAVAAGQIPAGATYSLVYDGTYFQIVGSVTSAGYNFTSPLVDNTGTVTVTVGSSGGVEAWNANLDTLASPSSTSGYVWTMTGTNTAAFEPASSYTLSPATTGSLGGVIPDGVTITVDGYGDIAVGSVPWSDLNSVPTTVAGLGITNGYVIDTWGTKTAPSGTVVGTIDSQTLTNKSIASTEITGLPTFPSGTIVGTSDSQTLTNKSIGASEVNSGTLTVPQGGTGAVTLTPYAILFGGTTSTSPIQTGTLGTAGQVLTSNGAGTLPTFQALTFSTWSWFNTTGGTSGTFSNNTQYYISTFNGSAFTGTLPASASDGNYVIVADPCAEGYGQRGWATGAVTVTSGTSNIYAQGSNAASASSVVLKHNGQITSFVYSAAISGWIQIDHIPFSRVSATLSSGSVTITGNTGTVPPITTSSVITATHMGTNATNAGALYVSALSTNSFTIKSTNSSDSDNITILVQ